MTREIFWRGLLARGMKSFAAGLSLGIVPTMHQESKWEQVEWAARQPYAGRVLNVHVIDIFTPVATDDNFNHGETVCRKIASGGIDPSLAGWIIFHRYNVGQPAGGSPELTDQWAGKIAQVLESIVTKAKANPQAVDAVNISLQDFDETPNTRRVRARINELLLLGIPVVIAAGNMGPGARNTLAVRNAFVVVATENGELKEDSGKGNVRAEGRSTSFAAVAATPLLARARAEGKRIAEMRTLIKLEMQAWGGTLPSAAGEDIFGESATELKPLLPADWEAVQELPELRPAAG